MCPRSLLRLQRIAAKSTQIAIATRCVYLGGLCRWAREKRPCRAPPPSPARPMRVFGVVLPSQWHRPNTLFAAQTITIDRRQVV